MAEAVGHRCEPRLEVGLSGGGERSQCSAVEGPEQGDHLEAIRAPAAAAPGRASFSAVSLAVAPQFGQRRRGRGRRARQVARPDPPSARCGTGWRCGPASPPAGNRRGHRRVGVPNCDHGDPAETIEVPVPVLVPQPGALTPYEHHRAAPIGVHEHGGGAVHDGHACSPCSTMVPIPSGVKISSSRACCTLPSRMWTRRTPGAHGGDTGAQLGQHPTGDVAPLQHLFHSGESDRGDQAALITEGR